MPNVQPDEGISEFLFLAKYPGQEMRLKSVTMDFSYQKEFAAEKRSAYSTLINDCMRGDATLFDRGDGVQTAGRWWIPFSLFSVSQTQISELTGVMGPQRESDEALGARWQTLAEKS